MAAFLIGQPDPNSKPRHQQVRTARGHPSGPGLNQLPQGGIKPEPQLDNLQDTPWVALAEQEPRAPRGNPQVARQRELGAGAGETSQTSSHECSV
jgi:hypothetical protein